MNIYEIKLIKAQRESDRYVRDHLLIQFMQNAVESGTPIDTEPEEWYKAWIKWLKEREESHGKGSKI